MLEVAKNTRVIASFEGDFNLRKLDAAVEWLVRTGQFIGTGRVQSRLASAFFWGPFLLTFVLFVIYRCES